MTRGRRTGLRFLCVVAPVVLFASPATATERDVLAIYAAIGDGNCRLAGDVINVGMEHDEPKAYFFAGYLYDFTGCVDDDPVRAAGYYRKAHELGDIDAPEFIGLLHALGRGLPQDYAVAYDWYRKRQRTGEPLALVDEDAAQVAGYAMTAALLARQYALYPPDARRAGTEASMDVVFDPATRQVEVRNLLATIETGTHVAKKETFVIHVNAAYQAGIALAPPLRVESPPTARFVTPWRFGRPRDTREESLRVKGPVTTGDTSPLTGS